MRTNTGSTPKTELAGGYAELSRTFAASFVFIAPLIVVYHIGLLAYPGAQNGVQPVFEQFFSRFAHLGPAFFSFLMLGLLCFAIWATRNRQPRQPWLYARMMLEACGWAALMLAVARLLPLERMQVGGQGGSGTEELLHGLEVVLPDLVASAGAGVYEELIFRLLLMGGIVWIFHRYLGGALGWVVPLAIIASALAFSYAHHAIGREVWAPRVFWYRAAMGAFLGGIFWFRGLGIVVYAHTLYNVVVSVVNHL